MVKNIEDFIAGMPKADLHVHFDGVIEAEQMLQLAGKNGVELPYKNLDEALQAQDFGEPALDNFLEYFFNCASVLCDEQDFCDVTRAFLERCYRQNVLHVELQMDVQNHTSRGIALETIFAGVLKGVEEARQQFDISVVLILAFLRERSLSEAMELLEAATPYKDAITAVGLDASQANRYQPADFRELFARAREQEYKTTIHCFSEDYPEQIWQCLKELKVDRIDHGHHALEDGRLIDYLVEYQVPLTMCPTWRPSDPGPRRLNIIKKAFEKDLLVTLNTDDPGILASGHLNKVMAATQRHSNYSASDMLRFAANGFKAAFSENAVKQDYLGRLRRYAEQHGMAF